MPERLEQRVAIAPDGAVTAFSGKVEFGQGIRTGFAQIVADELDVPLDRVTVVMGDTDQVPHDFGTFGSHSTQQEAPVLRRAAAFGRAQLLACTALETAARTLTRAAIVPPIGSSVKNFPIRTKNGFPGGCGSPRMYAAAMYSLVSHIAVEGARVAT